MPGLHWLLGTQLLLTSQCLLMAIYLARKQVYPYLMAFLLTVMFHVISGLALMYPAVSVNLTHVFFFLYGPLFLGFVCEVLEIRPPKLGARLVHLLPCLIATPLPFLAPIDRLSLVSFAATPLILFYLGVAIYLLKKARKLLPGLISDTSAIRVRWLEGTIYAYGAIMVADLAHQHLIRAGLISNPWVIAVYVITITAMYGLVSTMVFHALEHPSTFVELFDSQKESGKNPQDPYSEFGLDGAGVEEIRLLIESAMVEGQMFRQPQLTIHQLAAAIGLPSRIVSRILNTEFGVNFSEFVNSRRINAACAALRNDPEERRSLIDVAMDSGFNSKSTFNAVFKMMREQTPTEYRKSVSFLQRKA